jgi:hypothetical protein
MYKGAAHTVKSGCPPIRKKTFVSRLRLCEIVCGKGVGSMDIIYIVLAIVLLEVLDKLIRDINKKK